MPFTPLHIGPALLISLILYPLLDIPTFIIASIIIDIEPLYIILTGSPQPLHGLFHSLTLGILPAVALAAFIHLLRKYTGPINVYRRLPQSPDLRNILITSVTGVWMHVLLDAFLYPDLKLLYPLDLNPLLGLLTQSQVTDMCLYSLAVSIIVYLIRMALLSRKKPEPSIDFETAYEEEYGEIQTLVEEEGFEKPVHETGAEEPIEEPLGEPLLSFMMSGHEPEEEEGIIEELVLEVPSHTYMPDIFLGTEQEPRQWGIIGRSGDSLVAVDLNEPHIVFISGKQGSGKSYTIGVLSEMLLSGSVPNISQVAKPATLIVFHKPREDMRSEFWSIIKENTNPEEVYALAEYRVEPRRVIAPKSLKIFIDPFVHQNERRKFEEDYGTRVYPIGINPSRLTAEDWPHVLSIGKKSGSMYVKKIFQIIKRKQYDADFGLDSIRREIDLSDLNPNQKGFAYMRLETLQDYLEAGDFTRDIEIGGVNIFDLRKIMMEPDDIFSVMILVISAILNSESYFREQFVFVINEAHDYLRKGLSKDFTDYVNYLIRKKRHAGTWLMLDTHFPEDVDSKVIKGSDIKIFHKSDILSSSILRRIVDGSATEPHKLETGQAIIRADKSTRGPDILLETSVRPRLTHHGGATKTAV